MLGLCNSSFLARAFLLCVGLISIAELSACGHGGPPPTPPAAVNVAILNPVPVSEWQHFSGQLVAIESVEVRPRVGGFIDRIAFSEGSDVRKGALLVQLDDREYRAAVDAAKANLARANARLDLANSESKRTESLLKSNAASASEMDQRRAEANQSLADKDSAVAQLKSAELNLEFAHISAPFDGRVGKAEIRTGNLVVPNTTLLTTLVRLDPIDVEFSVDEQTFMRLRQSGPHAKVRVGLSNDATLSHQGEIIFVDNQLDRTSGTIRLRARFSNTDHQLIPGLFVAGEVESSTSSDHLLISERAVQTDQDRQFVYIVNENNQAIRKDVTLGARINGLVSVATGLAAGDKVIVDGTRKIFASGQPVAPTVVDMMHPEGGNATANH